MRIALTRTAPVAARARKGLVDTLIAIDSRHRQRRALSAMEDARLRDLGLSRAAAAAESRRSALDVLRAH